MSHRIAIYFAPALDSPLGQSATRWLERPELQELTVSARRYGFHATLKAPFALATDRSAAELAAAVADFAAGHAPVALNGLAPRLVGGFLALTSEPQPEALTRLGGEIVTGFEPFRAPLTDAERARRLAAPLSPRQAELVDAYGYPYVLEQFLFHMTLSDRLPPARQAALLEEAGEWFAAALAETPALDRLVLFTEAEPGAAFVRGEDFMLTGGE